MSSVCIFRSTVLRCEIFQSSNKLCFALEVLDVSCKLLIVNRWVLVCHVTCCCCQTVLGLGTNSLV